MTGLAAATPLLSVIIATYNRAPVLAHAIRSVIASTFSDWELLVIGDACTDDTEERVRAFGDPRIRFINLASRCGDQSGPSNHGVSCARGRYLAFLNHDDLHRPRHLANAVEVLDQTGCDFTWCACLNAMPRAGDVPADRPVRFTLTGVPSNHRYSPFAFYFASSWVLRRSVVDRIGPWPSAREVFVAPSQVWMFRAARAGLDLRFRPSADVIVVPAGIRPGAYAQAGSRDHDWLTTWLSETPDAMEQMLLEAAIDEASIRATTVDATPLAVYRKLLLRPVYAALIAAGIHPRSVAMWWSHGGRGGLIRDHQRRVQARPGD